MKVREFVKKRVAAEQPDGTWKYFGISKSVVLENGTTVRWNKKGQCWSIMSAPRWNSAVATSLSRYALTAAEVKGSLQSDRETYHAFSNFQTRMATLVDVETFLEIVNFLK